MNTMNQMIQTPGMVRDSQQYQTSVQAQANDAYDRLPGSGDFDDLFMANTNKAQH